MAKALYCPFPRCKVEYYTYCALHQAILPAIEKVAEQLDPENILTRSVVYANLAPMVMMMEEQWRNIKRLERQLHSAENEVQRLTAGT